MTKKTLGLLGGILTEHRHRMALEDDPHLGNNFSMHPTSHMTGQTLTVDGGFGVW